MKNRNRIAAGALVVAGLASTAFAGAPEADALAPTAELEVRGYSGRQPTFRTIPLPTMPAQAAGGVPWEPGRLALPGLGSVLKLGGKIGAVPSADPSVAVRRCHGIARPLTTRYRVEESSAMLVYSIVGLSRLRHPHG